MQGVLGYAVWPSPSQVSTCPTPSMVARSAVFSYGVAGSPVVPTTTIGGAPVAGPTGDGSRGFGHQVQDSRPVAIDVPHTRDFCRHSPCSCRACSGLITVSVSAQFTARFASNRLV